MTQKRFKAGDLVKIWPAKKVQPIIGVVVDVFNTGNAVSYRILSDVFYNKSENHVSHIDYNIDKEIDYNFPLIKRIFPNLLLPNIISIQPMQSPRLSIFSMSSNIKHDV